MSCTRCSTSPCRCKSSCSRCNTVPCGCAVPFYNTADVCEEDNCQKIYLPQFYFAVCPDVSWNVPQCGFSAILSVPGVQGASVGSYLWHTAYGYFQIISVDSIRGQIGIVNNCTPGNALPGTQIPGCTCFVVTVPPPDSLNPDTGKVCLEFDFTAPAVGNCIDIIVSQTTGLTSPSTVQIGTGFYLLSAVHADNILTICNTGDGITPGTPVVAKDVNGNFNYCLSIVSSNPCDKDFTPGQLLVCSGEGESGTLFGCGIGWSPVTVDADCNVEFFPPEGGPDTCTRLTLPLTITTGIAVYTLTVADSSIFVVDNQLTIVGRSERFKVTAIPDGTHIEVLAVPTPGANAVVVVDTFVCLVTCCESIINCNYQERIEAIPAALVSRAVIMGDVTANQWESIPALIPTVVDITAPEDCPAGTIYHYVARLNVSVLLDYDHAAAAAIPVISGEVQAYWANQNLGGRFNWVDTEYDGFPTAMAYPAFTFYPVWSVLTLLAGNYPMTFHSGEIIAETILFPGQNTSLILDAKLIQGEALPPTAVRLLNVYIVGELIMTRTLGTIP